MSGREGWNRRTRQERPPGCECIPGGFRKLSSEPHLRVRFCPARTKRNPHLAHVPHAVRVCATKSLHFCYIARAFNRYLYIWFCNWSNAGRHPGWAIGLAVARPSNRHSWPGYKHKQSPRQRGDTGSRDLRARITGDRDGADTGIDRQAILRLSPLRTCGFNRWSITHVRRIRMDGQT